MRSRLYFEKNIIQSMLFYAMYLRHRKMALQNSALTSTIIQYDVSARTFNSCIAVDGCVAVDERNHEVMISFEKKQEKSLALLEP